MSDGGVAFAVAQLALALEHPHVLGVHRQDKIGVVVLRAEMGRDVMVGIPVREQLGAGAVVELGVRHHAGERGLELGDELRSGLHGLAPDQVRRNARRKLAAS